MEELLRVTNLKTHFFRPDGVVRAVDGISYTLNKGESLAIMGESGCGKSVGVMSLIQLVRKPGRIVEGQALFEGRDLLKMGKEEIRQIRGHCIAMIFQDPMTSLNPTLTIGKQITEPMLWHNYGGRQEARERAIKLLEAVGIPSPWQRFTEYPFQFSGGMKQRVMIAMALACEPRLIIADEPTTALDVTVQAQILDLLRRMKEETGTSVLMITHDLGVAADFCDKVMVMYAGRVAEQAPMEEFVERPYHPYSRGLMNSTLDLGRPKGRLDPIPGAPPSLLNPPAGCRFHPRCSEAMAVCSEKEPELVEVGPGRKVACWTAEKEGCKN
ncbi:MAG: ABC transporter ATP-binding protein [Bacillota bacterium]